MHWVPTAALRMRTRDTYAHAFVLLGLAYYYALTNDAQILAIVDSTLTFLDDGLASDQGGYLDAAPSRDAIRRQNPHMHLLEALLALYSATGCAQYLRRASQIVDLFCKCFFRSDTGTLCEYLTAQLQPLPGPSGRIVEPGHHYEWIWLLGEYQRLSGRNVGTFTSALYDFADQYGWDQKGYIVDEVDVSGTVVAGSRRTWPHTEGLKANIVEDEHGRSCCDQRAAKCVARLVETFLGRPIPAGWVDRVTGDGVDIADFVPASTLYHVFCAVTEAARATR